jgi:hypothetical protein
LAADSRILKIKRFGGFRTGRGTVSAVTAPPHTLLAHERVAVSYIA